MGFNVFPEIKDQVGAIVVAPWGTCVKYLGVWLVDTLESTKLIDLSLTPVLKSVQQLFTHWTKL